MEYGIDINTERLQGRSAKPKAQALQTTFFDEDAVIFTWGDFQATVLPNVGANLISLRDIGLNFKFLREPDSKQMKDFRANPYLYGIPILFPPNRYDRGRVPYGNTEYQLPVNEPSTGNHLHGFLYDVPWQVEDFGVNETESFVVLTLTMNRQHPRYSWWPHSFKLSLRYGLNELGLSQHMVIQNLDSRPMPCLLGFHTAFNAPFAENSCPEDYFVRVTIGQRWELNQRGLPTGKLLELTEYERKLQQEGANPYVNPLDNHYQVQLRAGRNRMELYDKHNGVKLIYDVSAAFREWMIWNNQGRTGFFCTEPQVNVVNAPNLMLPAETIGLYPIEPGEIWEATSRIYWTRRESFALR